MDNIQGMFGQDPALVQQAINNERNQQAMALAQQDFGTTAAYGMGQGAGMLAQGLGSAAGYQDPRMQEAQQMQQIQQAVLQEAQQLGIDPSQDVSGFGKLMAKKFVEIGKPDKAMKVMQYVQGIEAQAADVRLKQVQAEELPKARQAEALAKLDVQREAIQQKREAAAETLKQRAEEARMRSEDMRLSIAQRAEAARMHNSLLRAVQTTKPPQLTKGQEALDRQFGKEYAEYQASGGSADIEKQLRQLKGVSDELARGADYTGPLVGLIPSSVRSITNPRAVAAQNMVEEVAQRNLRLVLGAQFTQQEGERLIARAYNPQMPPAENKKRVDALINQIKTAAAVKEDAARYFEENGTLVGWKGRMPSLEDFDKAITSVEKQKPVRIKYNEQGQRVQ